MAYDARMGITIERVPAERTASMPVAAAAGGCCSCCCCCFHTLGGLIGAAIAKPKAVPMPEAPVATIDGAPTTPKYTAWKEYWTAFLIATLITIMILGFYINDDDKLLAMVVIYGMVTPLVQLGGSLIALGMMLSSKRPGRSERLWHLGKITLYSVIGAGLGFILVLLIFAK